MSTYNGEKLNIRIYGTSHADKIGAIVTGFPRLEVDEENLKLLMKRRSPSSGVFSTKRREPDEPIFEKGLDKILKKVGEECTEVIIAGKADDKKETIYEIADLAYHVMVLMVEMGISVEDVHRELASRHVIDHKVKQEKMTK